MHFGDTVKRYTSPPVALVLVTRAYQPSPGLAIWLTGSFPWLNLFVSWYSAFQITPNFLAVFSRLKAWDENSIIATICSCEAKETALSGEIGMGLLSLRAAIGNDFAPERAALSNKLTFDIPITACGRHLFKLMDS